MVWKCFRHGSLTRYVKLRFAHAPGIPGTFSPSPTSKKTASYRSRHTSRHVRHARAVMHVGIDNLRWRGKRSRHLRGMRNPQFCVSGKRPIAGLYPSVCQTLSHYLPVCTYVLLYACILFLNNRIIMRWKMAHESKRSLAAFSPYVQFSNSIALNVLDSYYICGLHSYQLKPIMFKGSYNRTQFLTAGFSHPNCFMWFLRQCWTILVFRGCNKVYFLTLVGYRGLPIVAQKDRFHPHHDLGLYDQARVKIIQSPKGMKYAPIKIHNRSGPHINKPCWNTRV